jgi:hypothetical protein
VGDLHVESAPRAQPLVLVVTGAAERVAGGDHAQHQPQDAGRVRTAVDEVTDERRAAAVLVRADGAALRVAGDGVAEVVEQRFEFGAAAVDVADDVEGTSPCRGRRRAGSGTTASVISSVS